MPLAIAGVGRSVGLWLPGAKVPGDGLLGSKLSAPQRDGVGNEGMPMDGEKTRGAGSQSQATSKACSVGPSSRMDASDLDEPNLVSGHAPDNQP